MSTVHLKSGHVQPVWMGHPWVFAQAIGRVEGAPGPGDVVEVRDPRGNFLGRGFFSPRSAIPVRLLTRDPEEALDDAALARRIQTAFQWRKELLGLPGDDTDSYRLVHAEGDGLPGLVVDRFAQVLAVQFLTVGTKRRQEALQRALVEATGARTVVEVASARHQKIEGFEVREGVVWGEPVERLELRERGLRYSVAVPGAPGGGQKTGYYFDQRETRALVESLARGRDVLDLYSYVGAFSLGAARGGARSVLSVDSSAAALEVAAHAAQQLADPSVVTRRRGDARKVMEELAAEKKRFGLVVLDPPKLASGVRDAEEARGHYRRLNGLALRLVEPGGLLLSCSCSQALGGSELLRAIAAGARDANRETTLLRMLGQPPDHPAPPAFPEGRYLKVAVLRVG